MLGATEAQLRRLIEDATKIGCAEALKRHCDDGDLAYQYDDRRTAYLGLLNIGRADDVLEIGSSLGQHTVRIAGLCGSVCGIELCPMQAEFSRIRCRENGLDNARIAAGGTDGKLPFADESFDLVVCNYVLEWSAGRDRRNPAAFQRGFLREMFRVLRPGGRLWLSTKNRFAILYLLGGRDEHLDVPFGNALPRAIQRLLRARRGRPAGYLHSWRGLQNMLDEIGFRACERILAWPDARFPGYIGPFDGFSSSDLAHKSAPDPHSKIGAWPGRRTRLSLPLLLPFPRLFRAVTNSIVFMARK